jgi:3-hydroxyacyl-[acyl-carrier-protein] dehydratase
VIEHNSEEVEQAFHDASKTPLAPFAEPGPDPILDRQRVQSLIPHRDPFLFVDQVSTLNLEDGLIVAYYDLTGANEVFAGHFPGHPIWPGVLQLEAIGQTGLILYYKQMNVTKPGAVAMTHILGARYIHPIVPGGHVQICARIFENGLFTTVVGQCLHNRKICSIAAINCY